MWKQLQGRGDEWTDARYDFVNGKFMSNEIKGNISLCSSMEFEACTRVEFLYFRPPLPPTTELCRKTL